MLKFTNFDDASYFGAKLLSEKKNRTVLISKICENENSVMYNDLKDSPDLWFCVKCIGHVFPHDLDLFTSNTSLDLAEGSSSCPPSTADDQNTNNSADETTEKPSAKFLNYLFEDSIDGHIDDTPCKYYDVDEFTQFASPIKNRSALSFFHLNIASLPCHFDDLDVLLKNSSVNFNFIGVTETKIQTSTISDDCCIDSYQYSHTQNESESQNGGALLYISNDIAYIERQELNNLCYSSKELESCFIEVPSPKKKSLVVGCIYRHPSMNINEFNNNYLNPLLHKISMENKNLVLMGDFNINLLNAEHDANISNFVDILSSYSLLPHINLPTRITQHSKTLIDNIFSNLNSDFFSGNILAGISDHLPQFLLIDKFSKYSFVPNYQYRNWKKLNQEIFLQDFKDIQWNKILKFDKNDVNLSFTLLFETLDKLIEKHAPLQTLSRRSKQRTNKPWITKGIIKSMYTRNKLFQSYQREKNPILKCELLTKYKSYRNLITILCKQSKDQYYKSYFATNLHNSKSIWKGINSILGRSKNNKNSSVKSLLVDNSVCSDPQIIANTFSSPKLQTTCAIKYLNLFIVTLTIYLTQIQTHCFSLQLIQPKFLILLTHLINLSHLVHIAYHPRYLI